MKIAHDPSDDEPSRTSDAQEAFERWLAGALAGDAADFDAWCGDHPKIASELRRLHAQWTKLEAALGDLDGRGDHREGIDEGSDAELERERTLIARLRARSNTHDRYRIEAEIGRGGEGCVYRAFDTELSRHVAMKVMHAPLTRDASGARRADVSSVVRFLSEASTTARLDHNAIAPVHDLGIDAQGRLFFTMKLVSGRRLDQAFARVWAREKDWDEARILAVLLRVCEAVEFAHARGFVHRDLKPSNILVGDFGEVHVMDWGLALSLQGRPASSAARSSTTAGNGSTRAIGTAPYMSLEQARGDSAATGPASDVYALGALLHHYLARTPPYVQPGAPCSHAELVRRMTSDRPARILAIAPRASFELAAIAERAMERDPADRYQSAKAFADDLVAFRDSRRGIAWRETTRSRVVKLVRRHPAGAAAALVAVPLVCLVAWLSLVKVPEHREDLARIQRDARVSECGTGLELMNELYDHWVSAFDPREPARRTGLDALEKLSKGFASLDLDVAGDVSIDRLRSRIEAISSDDSEQAAALSDRLIEFHFACDQSLVGDAARLRSGGLKANQDSIDRSHVKSLALSRQELCKAYATTTALLHAMPLTPGRRRFVEVSQAFFARAQSAPSLEELAADWNDSTSTLLAMAPLAILGLPEATADATLERFSAEHPDAASLHRSLGWRYLRRSVPAAQKAKPHAAAWLAVHPESAGALDLWGSACLVEGAISEAIASFRRYVARAPNRSLGWTRLAAAFLAKDEQWQALSAADRACQTDDASPQAHLNRGVALSNLRKPEAAVEAFQTAIVLDPSYTRAWTGLVRALAMCDRLDDAIAARERAPGATLEDPALLEAHGIALLERGEPWRAACTFERAVSLAGTSGAMRAGLARAYIALEDTNAASAALVPVASSPHAREWLARVFAAAGSPEIAARQASLFVAATWRDLDEVRAASPIVHVQLLTALRDDPSIERLWAIDDRHPMAFEIRALRANLDALIDIARGA